MPIEYQNLEIEFSRSLSWEVRFLESPFDRPREQVFELEGFSELRERINILSRNILRGSQNPQLRRLAVETGIGLYKLLLPGRLRQTFQQSRSLVNERRESQDLGLRLRLSFGGNLAYDPQLVSLPWELLCDPEAEEFLAKSPQTPVVRYLDVSQHERPIRCAKPLKILAVLASPIDDRLKPIDTQRHFNLLEQVDLKSPWLHFERLERATLADLKEKLKEHCDQGEPFQALHFLGHGLFHEGHGSLCFETSDRRLDLVRGSNLADLLSEHGLKLAILATCSGAKMMQKEGQNPFNGVASSLVATRLSAVVGMQFNIGEKTAGHFSEAFYKTLGSGPSIDIVEATTAGRQKILEVESESLEWATPVLFLRSQSGHLFDLKGAEPEPKKIAIFNILDHGADQVKAAHRVDLRKWFYVKGDEAYIKDQRHWNEDVFPLLKGRLSSQCLPTAVSYRLVMAAPISVAFVAGRLLAAGSNHKIVVDQRGLGEEDTWAFDSLPEPSAAPWMPPAEAQQLLEEGFPGLGQGSSTRLSDKSNEVAIAVSVTHHTLEALNYYLFNIAGAPKVGYVLHAYLPSKNDQLSIEDGAHAAALASNLVARIHAFIGELGRERVHLFMAVPNGFAYIMGRFAKNIPEIQLYEYDLTGGDDKTYSPSILLESPAEAS